MGLISNGVCCLLKGGERNRYKQKRYREEDSSGGEG